MKKTEIGTTSVYIEAIAPAASDARATRRQREKDAVARISEALGIDITHDADGAPHIAGAFISVSHSMGLAVVAIDPSRPVGIDAEDWRNALRRVKPKFLSVAETERFADDDSLLKAWTAKEAVYKAMPSPRASMTEIECEPGFGRASVRGMAYALESWLEGDTRITLATPLPDSDD